MINEILFAAVLFGGLAAGTAAAWAGRVWVEGYIVTLFLYINLAEGKVIEVFGLPTTLGTALYGVIAFALDAINERWGRGAAIAAIYHSVAASVAFQILLALTRAASPIAEAEPMAAAMAEVFAFSARVTAASLIVYALAQSLDAWVYAALRRWTGGRHLWLRSKGSTLLSQAFDSLAFSFLAFFGVYQAWLTLAATNYLFKASVALVDTGFLYIVRAIPKSGT